MKRVLAGAAILAVAVAGVSAGRAASSRPPPREYTIAEAYAAGVLDARQLKDEFDCVPASSGAGGISCLPTDIPFCWEQSPAEQGLVGRLQNAVWAARGHQPECQVSPSDITLMTRVGSVGPLHGSALDR